MASPRRGSNCRKQSVGNAKVCAVVLAITVLWPAAPSPGAGSLSSDALYLLPLESGEVVFLDLQTLRDSPHYSLLKQRLLGSRFRAVEPLLRSLDVEKGLDWVAWVRTAPNPGRPRELFLGIAQGRFAPEKAEQFLLAQKVPLDAYRGQTLFPLAGAAGADLFLAFLNSTTAAFGTRAGLELLLETRFGAHGSLTGNALLRERLDEVNGRAPAWAVFDPHYTQEAVRRLLPEAAKFAEFPRVAEGFRSSLLRVNVDQDVALSFQILCSRPADAQELALLLETGLMAQSWKAAQSAHSTLSSALRAAEVRASGERVDMHMAIAETDLRALLEPR